jgi:hypothetical protein
MQPASRSQNVSGRKKKGVCEGGTPLFFFFYIRTRFGKGGQGDAVESPFAHNS